MHPLVSESPVAAVLFWGTLAGWFLGGPRARKSAGEVRRDQGTFVWIIASIGLAIGLGIAAAQVDALAIPVSRWALFVVGLLLMWLGIALAAWAGRTLGRFYRPVVAIQEDHEVVATGPYRYVRHPIYAAALLVLLGAGVSLGSWLSVILLPLVPLPAYLARIRVEERALEEGLGERYVTYERGRARLVPGVW
jgi:protein-S-isoprenylcysteine O-methyltransferase Ste14